MTLETQVPEKSITLEKKQKAYNKIKIRLTVIDTLMSLCAIAFIAFSGIAQTAADISITAHTNPYLQFLIFAALFGIGLSIIGFPLDFYGGFILEHRFGLSNQSFFQWAWEKLKGTLVGLVIGIPVALVFFYFLRSTGDLWWLYFSFFIFFISVFLARIAPVIIFPLFYKFKELEDDAVKKPIADLLSKYEIPIKGIYSFNMSKDTKKANAGFTGIGKSKRIILSDTLIEDFTPEEIATVFAHEVGHYKYRHILKNLVFSTVIIFLSFYACGAVYQHTISAMGFSGLSDLAAIPVLFFFLTLFGLLMMPITNKISRYYEVEADTFALNATGDKTSFITTMDRLAELNLSDRAPHPLVEFLFYSHPSIQKRIDFAENFSFIEKEDKNNY